MKYVFGAIILLYGILSFAGPFVRIFQTKRKEYAVMLLGGIGLIASFIIWSIDVKYAWALGLASLIVTALGAWINGGINGERNIKHHIIRWIISVILLLGFIFIPV